MLTKVTKVKLWVFVTITVVTLLITALYYVRLPQQVGIGRYDLTVELSNAGGLYPQAAVTYRGVEVGKVTAVDLEPGGQVVARLQIDNGVELPADSTVEIRSASVIGEQYVNFVPPASSGPEFFADGATIPAERVVLPTTTDTLLTAVDDLLASVPTKDLRVVVDELGTALDGAGGDLARFIDASAVFQQAATENLPATLQLIDDSVQVLQTQRDLDPEIRSLASSLDTFSTQLRASDADLRGLIGAGAPFMRTVGGFALDVTGVAPGLLAELAQFGEVLRVYRDGVEHLLIVLPAVVQAFDSAIPVERRDDPRSPANLWFKLGFDPPTCTEGYEHADNLRNPDDITPEQPSTTSWCKVSAADIRAPRGARNSPCPNGGTGATAELCGLVFEATGRRTAPGAEETSDATPLSGPVELGVASFFFGGAAPSPETWQDLIKGLVKS